MAPEVAVGAVVVGGVIGAGFITLKKAIEDIDSAKIKEGISKIAERIKPLPTLPKDGKDKSVTKIPPPIMNNRTEKPQKPNENAQ